jgi:xylulokinase
LFLGLDVGTSAVKAVIVAEDGMVLGQANVALDIARPHPLWSEQAPEDWWRATEGAVGGLRADLRSRVRGVGLTGQMHGATLLDSSDRPLRAAILWNDGRSGVECAALEAREPASRSITGNLAMPGFTAPKLLWVRDHEPDIFERTKTVLLPKDFIRLRMTGEKATDLSDASGTLWVDVANRQWSSRMLAATGLSIEHMPSLNEGTAVTGRLLPKVAAAWGMDVVPVAAGGGDNAAGAAGVGVVEPGDALLSLGTSGVIFLANNRFRPNPDAAVHAFCHCLPDRWHQMSVMLNAAICVDWVARLTGHGDAGRLLAAVDAAPPAEGEVIFLPYLGGERTPHNNPHAKGVFFGLTHDTDGVGLGRAVLEGVALGLAEGLDALRAAGSEAKTLTVVGGGSRSETWGRIIAAALGAPLVYRLGADIGPAFGAARLAQVAVTGAAVEQVCAPPAIVRVIEPEAELVRRMDGKKERFRAVYRNLKDLFLEKCDELH